MCLSVFIHIAVVKPQRLPHTKIENTFLSLVIYHSQVRSFEEMLQEMPSTTKVLRTIVHRNLEKCLFFDIFRSVHSLIHLNK